MDLGGRIGGIEVVAERVACSYLMVEMSVLLLVLVLNVKDEKLLSRRTMRL